MQQPATLVEGKYEVLAKIREGGMGAIYKVRHRLLDEIRVIKQMRPNVASEEEFKRRFLDEAKTATRLKHPNICAIYDFALDPDGASYLVMEFIDGITLADLLGAQGAQNLTLGLDIAHQTLLALGFLHRKKIVHRDIAPDNLMLTVDDDGQSRVKLIDLGIAKNLDRQATEMTSSGVFLGKLRYASPEQFGALPRGEVIDGRSDLYSMGLVLYELLTGKKPIEGETPIELMRAHVYNPPLPFEETDRSGKIPKEIRQIILKALEKERGDRWATAEEFDRALQTASTKVDVPKVDVDGPTLILGIQQMTRTTADAGANVTPSAQDRLDMQFAAQKTPTAGPTMQAPAGKVEEIDEARQRQQRELEEIRRLEETGDLPALQKLAEIGAMSQTALRELQAAIQRAEQSARERREKEAAAWRRASEAGSEASWNQFLAEEPESPRRAEAEHHRAEAHDFQEAVEAESYPGWRSFLAKWSDGPHRKKAEGRLKALAQRDEELLAKARAAGTAEALRAFLADHADSHLASTARDLLAEQKQFDEASRRNDEPAWKAFLERWPSGARAGEASKRLQAARQQEEKAWKGASEEATATVLQKFIEAFPKGTHNAEAQALLRERTAFDQAMRQGKTGCERFLREYPETRFARAAQTRLKELEEEALFLQIRQLEAALQEAALEKLLESHPSNTTAGAAVLGAIERVREELERQRLEKEESAWAKATASARAEDLERFIKKHPSSPHVAEAREKLRIQEETLARIGQLEATLETAELQTLTRAHLEGTVVGGAAAKALERARTEVERRRREAEEAEFLASIGRHEAALQEKDLEKLTEAHAADTAVGKAAAAALARVRSEIEKRRIQEEETLLLEKVREHEAAGQEKDLEKLARAHKAGTPAGDAVAGALQRIRAEAARKARDAQEAEDEKQKERLRRKDEEKRRKEDEEAKRKAERAVAQAARAQAAAKPTPSKAAKPTTAVERIEEARPRRPARAVAIAGAAVLAIALIWVVTRSRSTPGQARPEDVPSGQSQSSGPAQAGPAEPRPADGDKAPAAVDVGQLAVDAQPWGRVERIEDPDGRRFMDGLPQYTPVTLQLPPGPYFVVVSNPRFPEPLRLSVQVTRDERAVVTGRFETIDPKAYFQSQGFGQ